MHPNTGECRMKMSVYGIACVLLILVRLCLLTSSISRSVPLSTFGS